MYQAGMAIDCELCCQYELAETMALYSVRGKELVPLADRAWECKAGVRHVCQKCMKCITASEHPSEARTRIMQPPAQADAGKPEQIAGEAGVLGNCLTLAQLIAENERLTAALEHCQSQAGPDSCAALSLECERLRRGWPYAQRAEAAEAKLDRVLAHCQQYRTSANEPGRQALACEVLQIIGGDE